MRMMTLRIGILGGLFAATAVAQQPATRPSPAEAKKLKDELDALLKEKSKLQDAANDPMNASELKELREKFKRKLEELGNRPPAPVEPKPAPPTLPPPRPVKPMPEPSPAVDVTSPIDPLRSAQNYFKAGDVDAAFKTLKMVKVENLSPDDRVFAQYLAACCLRRQGKLSEASVLFREIADGKHEEFYTESAITQLAAIRNLQELEGQLEQLRAKRKSK